MASLELKITGINKRDMAISLAEMAEAFGVQTKIDLSQVVETADLNELFELVKERFAAQGFELTVNMPDMPEGSKLTKRGRKPKVVEEALTNSETSEETKAYTDDELNALKAATLARIGNHWTNDEGRIAMQKILKEHGGGSTLFRDTPTELFPAIAAAVDAYEGL